MAKKLLKYISICILFIAVFIISYYCTIKIDSKKIQAKKPNNSSIDVNTESSQITQNDSIDYNTKIIFKNYYKKSKETIVEKTQTAGELGISSKKQLADKYGAEGYEVQSISKAEISLIKELEQYSPNKNLPNKYVLGIYNGFIAIYKTDKDGNMYIEDTSKDITKVKVSNLKEEDIRLLNSGELQFNSKEEAEAKLEDYI